ncbi:hypothetical protein [Streptomyces sp. TBY4]|uniref:hypothetical protein n=1 Tax=Streptomyces sp. TBY4 TaxID=2962030 RepID=UPI0020B7A1F7|nr:hypothetical protein [Streptomyces sp. TBY4]MCP3753593.1 hypothetical protein [Streptomyces sp. TBY4]
MPWGTADPAGSAPDGQDTALVWYEALQKQGIVARRAVSPYWGGRRIWEKARHAETVDTDVLGFTGTAARPRHLVVRLPGGQVARPQQLTAPLAAQVAHFLGAVGQGAVDRTPDGEPYQKAGEGLVVDVLAGTTRHAVVTVVCVHG